MSVAQPHIIYKFNNDIQGVGCCDQNIGFNRTNFRGKKLWFCITYCYCFDLNVQNIQNFLFDHISYSILCIFSRSEKTLLLSNYSPCTI